MDADSLWFAGLVAGVALLTICACCVAVELRQCRKDWDDEAERRRRTKLNGIDEPAAIELIGARPESERPPGVDWSISLWAEKRGEYSAGDRGYAGLRNVNVDGGGTKDDKMETFWLAETLKYFLLLFSEDSLLNLDTHVLNTEAHPLQVMTEG